MKYATCRQSPSSSDFAGPLRRPFTLYVAVANGGCKQSAGTGERGRGTSPLGELPELQRPGQGALGFGGQLRLVAADEMGA